jgi:flagellar basal-body rod protein FlgG
MNGAFYVGATGLQAQQRALDVVANNISNINTMGFKRSEVRFAELVGPVTQTENADPILVRPATDALSGVQAREAVRIFQQGDLRETGKPFDIAISGDGFIELLGPSGETWLWRGGTLRVNADGLLETESGLALKALIEVPEDSTELRIDRDGVVRSLSAGLDAAEELGTISLAMPRDPELVEAMGSGFYRVPDDGELETVLNGQDGGVIVQGSLEASNVELTTEMVSLLLLQRAYAANAQAVQAGDQLMSIANNLRR